MRLRRDLSILALLVVLSHLPFLWRPFHIDDRIYLEVARQAARIPLYPQDYHAVFEGKHGPDAASHSHPPLVSYLLALLGRIRGQEDELFFHAVFLVFPVILAAGVYLLALDRTRRPLVAALLAAWNPAVYILSQSVMTDVPFLALYTLGLALFYFGERDGRDWRWPAAGLLAVAAMVNYLALSALPLLLAAERFRRRPLARLWPMLLLPAAVVAAWVGLQSAHYGRFILATTVQFATTESDWQWSSFDSKLLSALLGLGGMLLITCLFRLRRLAAWLVWGSLAAGAAGSTALLLHWHWLHCLLLGGFLATGIWTIKECFARPLDPLLQLWILGFLAACVLVFYHGSVRYVLPLIPPAVILLLRNIQWRRMTAAAAVAVTFLYATVLAHADYRFAAIYPRIADQVFGSHAGQAVWGTGEWGFRYYMEEKGAGTLARDDQRPAAGDLLVKPALAMPYVTAYDNGEHVDLIHREFVFLSNPVRLLDFASHAGFYSSGWGILPWSVETERSPVEIFNFFRVKKRFEGDPDKVREEYFRK